MNRLARVLADRRTDARLLVLALAAGLVCWYLGADVWHAILLGVAVTVVAVGALANTRAGDPRDLWWVSDDHLNERGSRDDITRLAQSLREGLGFAGETAEIRVRQLARRRLALEGLDLQDRQNHPEIVRRLGAGAAKALLRENIMGMRVKTMLSLLDALDALDPTQYPHR